MKEGEIKALTTQNNNLSKIIKTIRIQHKMTQEKFGNIFTPAAAKSIVSRWEKGQSVPSPERLLKISELSGYSVEELLYGTLQNAITELAKEAWSKVDAFFRNQKKLNKEISSSSFISSSSDPSERQFLEDVFSFAIFKKESYFGTPRPKALVEKTDKRTQTEQKEIYNFYRQECTAGYDLLCNRAYNVCKKTGVKPYEKEKIMHILAKEAELAFNDIDRNNEGLVNFAVGQLDNLYANEIPHFIYGRDSNDNEVKLSSAISTDLEKKIENMIANLSNEIYNLVQQEE